MKKVDYVRKRGNDCYFAWKRSINCLGSVSGWLLASLPLVHASERVARMRRVYRIFKLSLMSSKFNLSSDIYRFLKKSNLLKRKDLVKASSAFSAELIFFRTKSPSFITSRKK